MTILYKILMAFLKPSIVSTVCSGTLDDLKQSIENEATVTFLAKQEVKIGVTTNLHSTTY